jgi:primosomal replication protein N
LWNIRPQGVEHYFESHLLVTVTNLDRRLFSPSDKVLPHFSFIYDHSISKKEAALTVHHLLEMCKKKRGDLVKKVQKNQNAGRVASG